MEHGTTPVFSPQETTENLPTSCGVYLMKDADDTIIYVGKAKNLKTRVRSYFSGRKDPKTAVLIQRVARIDFIVTRNEYEALLLENNLIKKWNPRYNINLKDGKTYPVIRITNEEYPRVFRTRTVVQDGSDYFGPYPNVESIEHYLELAERLYPLRKCRGPLKRREHPCLYHHIGRCSGPCAGRISREDYLKHVDGVRNLLSGETDTLRSELERSMIEASQEMEYERAAALRDLVRAIDTLQAEQKVVDFDPETRDYVAFASEQEMCTFAIFQMRAGHLLASDMFAATVFAPEAEALEQFIVRYYDTRNTAPANLYLPIVINRDQIAHYFRQEHNADVRIEFPSEGRHASVLAMARENALQDLERRKREHGNLPALRELASVLQLAAPPLLIEGFDIAHVGGRYTVASMVVFHNGIPDRSRYRRFHIRSLEGSIDDFEAMREVIARRYQRVANERLPRPDLILIDGGKGQLNAAAEILGGLGMEDIPLVGLAKRLEEVFVPQQPEPMTLPEGSPPLRLLQYVRDEAHRFATSFRSGLQSKDLSRSTLENVPGIGPRRSRRILRAFGSLEVVAEAPTDVLAKSCGLTEEIAEAVRAEARRHSAADAAAEVTPERYRADDSADDGHAP